MQMGNADNYQISELPSFWLIPAIIHLTMTSFDDTQHTQRLTPIPYPKFFHSWDTIARYIHNKQGKRAALEFFPLLPIDFLIIYHCKQDFWCADNYWLTIEHWSACGVFIEQEKSHCDALEALGFHINKYWIHFWWILFIWWMYWYKSWTPTICIPAYIKLSRVFEYLVCLYTGHK